MQHPAVTIPIHDEAWQAVRLRVHDARRRRRRARRHRALEPCPKERRVDDFIGRPREQANDDRLVLPSSSGMIDCSIAEVKERAVEFNKPLTDEDDPRRIANVLRMFGVFGDEMFNYFAHSAKLVQFEAGLRLGARETGQCSDGARRPR